MSILKYRFLESSAADGGAGGGEQGGGEQGGGGDADAAAERVQVEKEARKIGWRPKEQFRGNPEDWVDAGEFVERGKTFVPFLNAERHRLQGELQQRDARIQELNGTLQATKQAVEELTSLHAEMAEERNERRKAEVGAELRSAREAGDDVKVAELQNELQELTKTPEEKPKPKPQPPRTEPQLQPWLRSWLDTNKEDLQNVRFTGLFNAVVAEKRAAGDTRGLNGTDGTELMEEVKAEVYGVLRPNTRRQAPSRTEEGRPSGGGSGARSTGKSYGDLPAEAKAKCDSQEVKFVGEGKLFKTQADWRKHYAGEYFAR